MQSRYFENRSILPYPSISYKNNAANMNNATNFVLVMIIRLSSTIASKKTSPLPIQVDAVLTKGCCCSSVGRAHRCAELIRAGVTLCIDCTFDWSSRMSTIAVHLSKCVAAPGGHDNTEGAHCVFQTELLYSTHKYSGSNNSIHILYMDSIILGHSPCARYMRVATTVSTHVIHVLHSLYHTKGATTISTKPTWHINRQTVAVILLTHKQVLPLYIACRVRTLLWALGTILHVRSCLTVYMHSVVVRELNPPRCWAR